MDKDLFADSSHAEKYANLRPKVPSSVADAVVNFMKQGKDQPSADLVIDIGCGSGQSTSIFAPHFTKALGVDPSESQIKFAKQHNQTSNVEFQVGSAESLPVASSSTSLVVAMTAAHWFDLDQFYDECRRMLMPGGVITLGIDGHIPDFTSMRSQIWPDAAENSAKVLQLQKLVDDFEASLDWSPRVQHFKDRYRNLQMPREDFEIERREDCFQDVSWSLEEVLMFFTTWSGYNSFMTKNPKSQILKKLGEDLREILGEKRKETFCFVDQYVLVLMRKL